MISCFWNQFLCNTIQFAVLLFLYHNGINNDDFADFNYFSQFISCS